jgi:protein-ribulosamine 3-kinase
MMEGEFNSMSAIYGLIPSFVPKPQAWGKFKLATPETYFFLCDFVEMSNDMPDPVAFCARVAELHRISVSNGEIWVPYTNRSWEDGTNC